MIAAGFNGQATVEDLFVARLIAQRLAMRGPVLAEGDWSDHPVEGKATEVLRSSPSGQELRDLGYREDGDFCAQIDVLHAAPIYRGDGFVA